MLWYVTERTAAGDVPLRDVRSYEPGRYYWSAAWLRVLGPGVKTLRISLAALQGVGLLLAFLLLRRVVQSVALLAVLGLIVVVWMWPMYRSFENVAVLALLLAAARLVERPVASRWRAAGIVVGVAAFVRIDHGVYGALAFLLLLVFTTTRLDGIRPGVAVANWALGVLVGYSPMFLLAVLAPGFVRGFTANLAYMARTTGWAGTVSLPLPVPWLWAVLPGLGGRSFAEAAASVALSTLFTLLPAVLVLAGFLAFRARGVATPQQAQLAAAAAVGVPYLSHTFSRADLQHLTPTAMTLVVAITALVTSLPAAARRLASLVAVPLALAVTYLVVVTETPYGIRTRRPNLYVRSDVAGDVLWLNRTTVEIIDAVKRATAVHVGARRLLVIPLWPGMYPILGKQAPLWRSTHCSRSRNHTSARRSRNSGVQGSTGCSWPTSCPTPEGPAVQQHPSTSLGTLPARLRLARRRRSSPVDPLAATADPRAAMTAEESTRRTTGRPATTVSETPRRSRGAPRHPACPGEGYSRMVSNWNLQPTGPSAFTALKPDIVS